MKISQLFNDDRAVSPVIGVILMVAITVILAAVIGTFVLGLGDQVQQTTPRVSFGFDTADSSTNVTATHESGTSVDSSSLVVRSTQAFNYTANASGNTVDSMDWATIQNGDGTVSAGDSVTVTAPTNTDFGGETIRIIYDSPDSDNTATLGEFEVPN